MVRGDSPWQVEFFERRLFSFLCAEGDASIQEKINRQPRHINLH